MFSFRSLLWLVVSVSEEDESHPLVLRLILVLELISLFVLSLNMISECTLLDSSVVALSNLTGDQTGIVILLGFSTECSYFNSTGKSRMVIDSDCPTLGVWSVGPRFLRR